MSKSSVAFCPVPTEQQPVNEYEQLKESWFFSWVTLTPFAYGRKLAWILLGGSLIAAPIAAASFPPTKTPVQFTLSTLAGAGLLLVLVLLRLYLGWFYIGDRLRQEKVSYEESGWYDGQVWEKPTSILNRDRLIVSYQVEPILARLRKTALSILILAVLGTITWCLI